MVAVLNPPGFHAKVPVGNVELAAIEPCCPMQMVSFVTVTIGVGFTVTVPDAEGLTHPAAVV
jgi:hypothetical protein